MKLGQQVGLGPGHIVLDGDPAPLSQRGTSPPLFGRCLLWPQSPILATAELLFFLPAATDYFGAIIVLTLARPRNSQQILQGPVKIREF